MAEDKTPSAFLDDEDESVEEIDLEARIVLFKSGRVDFVINDSGISSKNLAKYSEDKFFQALSSLISWIQAKRSAEAIMALSTQEEEQNSN